MLFSWIAAAEYLFDKNIVEYGKDKKYHFALFRLGKLKSELFYICAGSDKENIIIIRVCKTDKPVLGLLDLSFESSS